MEPAHSETGDRRGARLSMSPLVPLLEFNKTRRRISTASPPMILQLATVTISLPIPKLPFASVQLTQSVCTPLACCVEGHVKVALVPLTVSFWCGAVVVGRGGPPMSTPNLKAFELPGGPGGLRVTGT